MRPSLHQSKPYSTAVALDKDETITLAMKTYTSCGAGLPEGNADHRPRQCAAGAAGTTARRSARSAVVARVRGPLPLHRLYAPAGSTDALPGHQPAARAGESYGYGASAWKAAPHDRCIGWSVAQREARLQLVVNNARFLIFVQVRSRFHGAGSQQPPAARRLAGSLRLPTAPAVQSDRFPGTSYRAAGPTTANSTCIVPMPRKDTGPAAMTLRPARSSPQPVERIFTARVHRFLLFATGDDTLVVHESSDGTTEQLFLESPDRPFYLERDGDNRQLARVVITFVPNADETSGSAGDLDGSRETGERADAPPP